MDEHIRCFYPATIPNTDYPTAVDDSNIVINEGKQKIDKKSLPCQKLKVMVVFKNKLPTVASARYGALISMNSCTFMGFELLVKRHIKKSDHPALTVSPKIGIECLNVETLSTMP